MRTLVKGALAGIFLSATMGFLAAAPANRKPTDTLVGVYSCSGEQDSKPYTLELVIESHRDTYTLAWGETAHAARHAPTVIGLGIRNDNHLAVAIVDRSGGVGVVTYSVRSGRLDGQWSRGDGEVLAEACVKGRRAA